MNGIIKVNGKFTVGIILGSTPENFSYREFSTQAEAEAYMFGVYDIFDWSGYKFIGDMDEENEQELRENCERSFEKYEIYKKMVA